MARIKFIDSEYYECIFITESLEILASLF
jgi:hypothetical protein